MIILFRIIKPIILLVWGKIPQEITEAISLAWEKFPFSEFLKRLALLYADPELRLENSSTNTRKFAIWELFEALTLGGVIIFLGQYGFEKLAKIKFTEYFNPFILSLNFIINITAISILYSAITALSLIILSRIRNQFKVISRKIFAPLFLQTLRVGAFEILLLAVLGVLLFYRLFINCSFAVGINWIEIAFGFILSLYVFLIPLQIMIKPVYLILKRQLHPFISFLVCLTIVSSTLFVHKKLGLSTNREAIYFEKIKQDLNESPCLKRQPKTLQYAPPDLTSRSR